MYATTESKYEWEYKKAPKPSCHYLDELLSLFPDDAGDVLLKLFFEVWFDQTLPYGDSKDRLNVDLRECVCHFCSLR